MSIRTLAVLVLGAAVVVPVQAQRSSRFDVTDESTVTRTLSFAAGGGRTLDVRNINGFIHVEATDAASVEMRIRKEVRAETQEDLAEAERQVRLEFSDGGQRVGATVADRNGHVASIPTPRACAGFRRWPATGSPKRPTACGCRRTARTGPSTS